MNRRLSAAIAKWESSAITMTECEELISMLIEYNRQLILELQVAKIEGYKMPYFAPGYSYKDEYIPDDSGIISGKMKAIDPEFSKTVDENFFDLTSSGEEEDGI